MADLIVGCDPSSKCLAFYALSPVTPTVKARKYTIGAKTKYKPEDSAAALDACDDMIQVADSMATTGGRKFLFIEKPLRGRGGTNTTIVQSFVSGVVQACFVRAGYKVYLIDNQTWKSFIGVPRGTRTKSGQPKTAVVNAMKARFPKDAMIVGTDGDLLDAAAVARFGAETVRRGKLVEASRDVPDGDGPQPDDVLRKARVQHRVRRAKRMPRSTQGKG